MTMDDFYSVRDTIARIRLVWHGTWLDNVARATSPCSSNRLYGAMMVTAMMIGYPFYLLFLGSLWCLYVESGLIRWIQRHLDLQ